MIVFIRETGAIRTTIEWLREWQEYCVETRNAGHKVCRYHTCCIDDAEETADMMHFDVCQQEFPIGSGNSLSELVDQLETMEG